jgi:hypothetical protein
MIAPPPGLCGFAFDHVFARAGNVPARNVPKKKPRLIKAEA